MKFLKLFHNKISLLINIDENHCWAHFLHRQPCRPAFFRNCFSIAHISWKWRLNRFGSIIIARIKMHKCCYSAVKIKQFTHSTVWMWANGKLNIYQVQVTIIAHNRQLFGSINWFNWIEFEIVMTENDEMKPQLQRRES